MQNNPAPTPPSTPITPPVASKASLAIIFMIVFIDLLGFGIVLPLLPRYAAHFNATPQETGLLFASFSAMQFIFSPLWGRLSNRIGRRPVLIAGLAGTVVFYALFGVAALIPSLPLMFIARIGAGMAAATISTAQAYIADSTAEDGRARGMALIGAAFGIGFTFGPILGSLTVFQQPTPAGELAGLNPWPGFFAAILSLIAMIAACMLLPESLKKGVRPPARSGWNLAAILSALKVPTIGSILLLFFISTLAFSQFETTLSKLTLDIFLLSDASNFYLYTYIGITLTFMQGVLVRILTKYLDESTMILIGTVLMGLGLGLVGIAAEQRSLNLLIGIFPVLIAGFSFITPSAQSLLSRRSDPARQGEIMGVTQSASALARILAPMIGYTLYSYSPLWPYWVSAALLLPSLLLAISVAKKPTS